MGLLSSLLGSPRRQSLAGTEGPWRLSDAGSISWVGDAATDLTQTKALSLSSIFGAVSLLSQLYGSLPLVVYRQFGEMKEPATTHPAYRMLKTQANWEMTAMSARSALEWNRRLCGNAYAEIVWAGNGKPAAYYPLEAWRVRQVWTQTEGLWYQVDGNRRVEMEDMLHVPLVTADGVSGTSFMDWAADSLGLGISGQQFAGKLFSQGARPGGILRHPGSPKKEARDEFRDSWTRTHGGSENAGKTAVVWGGWEFSSEDGSFAPEQAQMIESMKFSVEEAARWLGVPPFVLAVLSSAGTTEQQMIQLLVLCMGPGLVAYEQEIDRKLLQPPNVYAKHNVGGLLRADTAGRSQFYREQFAIGVLSINDILELEERNPVEGGDTHFVPLNMRPLQQATTPTGTSNAPPPTDPGKPPAPPPSGQPAPPPGLSVADVALLIDRMRPLVAPTPTPPAPPAIGVVLRDTLHRLARLEANGVRRGAEKPGRFFQWMDAFYAAHELRMTDALRPLIGDAAPAKAAEWCKASREDLLAATDGPPAEFGQRITALLTRWESRVGTIEPEKLQRERKVIKRDPRTGLIESIEVIHEGAPVQPDAGGNARRPD